MEVEKKRIPNILVTGTPGTGKTTFCRLLNHSIQGFQFTYLNIGDLVNAQHLYKSFNQEFNIPQYDEDMVIDYLDEKYNFAEGGIMVDFHSSDFFPQRYFDIVILLRCDNKQLFDRLHARGYPQAKITANLQCEILEESHFEVHESWPKAVVLQLRNEEESQMSANIEAVIKELHKW